MPELLRHICAIICLAVMFCGGQVNACACALAAPQTACESHDHSHDSDGHDKSTPGDETHCPCATCHSCPHAHVALPVTVGLWISNDARPMAADESAAPGVQAADIFTPPKLA